MFDIDFAEPEAKFWIFPLNILWLIRCHKNILEQFSFVLSLKIKSGSINFLGVLFT